MEKSIGLGDYLDPGVEEADAEVFSHKENSEEEETILRERRWIN